MAKQQNQFDMYERLRSYQLHCQRMERQNSSVPNHEGTSPKMPSLVKAKEYHKNKKMFKIEHENEKIMHKLIGINQRKPHYMSEPNLSLPPIIKQSYQIPLYQQSNSLIAKKIIHSKPSINLKEQINQYQAAEQRKRRISKYEHNGSSPINRKKYLAELLLLKKLKSSRVLNPEI